MTVSHRSIAQVTFTKQPATTEALDFATGFLADTRDFGPVCVTCAHVVRGREELFVHGEPTSVVFDAYKEYGVDVALLRVPAGVLADPGVRYHRLGIASRANRIYYCLGWTLVPGHRSMLTLVKIWGPRTKKKTILEPGKLPHSVWELRNDVPDAKEERAFSSTNFASGWSGAPVFNVRRNVEEDRVVGILSVVAVQGGEALCISVENLDFLKPTEAQDGEARLIRRRRTAVRQRLAKLLRKEEFEYCFEDDDDSDSLYNRRFAEITQSPVSPLILHPPRSLYDELL